ncbi:MAG TPA: NAD(P)/FAD-dependent oxidoreductase [Micromonosporaceae bacterium]|jgi:2-polyprenyl-6-methoxyphenol hydroxylase-like FAD-dependent oxidoreductase
MPSAVIVGAGVAGLAVAGALARADWQVTLLEHAERLRADNAALLIWPNGRRALGDLGLSGGLDAIAAPVPVAGIRRPDGTWLVRPEDMDATATPPLVVQREDLHDTLFAGLGDRVDLRTGVGVRSVRLAAGQAAAVGDGESTWEADLVVGADGVDSVVRRRLAPEATMISSGCTAWRAVIPWYQATDLLDLIERQATAGPSGETVGAGHRFRYAVMGSRGSAGASSRGGIYWAATVPGAARPESAPAQLTLLHRWFADWHAPIGDLIAATDPDRLIQHPIGELWPMPRAFAYHAGAGGYALTGDAAHAMAHHRGDGACLALEDAAALVAAVSRVEPGPALTRALTSYSQERRGQVVRIGRQSRRIGAVLVSSRASSRTRDAVLGLAPGPLGRASSALRHLGRS